MFTFGSQYLRGMTPPRDDWDRDLGKMRELGFNTVRAWLVWGCVETAEERIDCDYLDTFMDLAARHGLRVGLLFHLHGAPEWLIRKHPEFRYVDAEGRRFEPSPRPNTPSGGWPGLCWDNAEVRGYEERFIAAVVKHLAGRKEIAFWEPMNEPHQWVDLAKNPVGHFCFCEATRERFREWLRAKYETLDALSHAWGRRLGDWQEARPPTWRFGYTDQIDFRLFTMDSVAQAVRRRAEVIRRHDARPVIAHAWGGGAVTCDNLGAMAFDDWENAEGMDGWGCSAFPDGSLESVTVLGLVADASRAAAGSREFWLSELGAGDNGYGMQRQGRIPTPAFAALNWESIRHGAKGILYWQYRKESQGAEFGFPGLTDYGGRPTANLLEAARIGETLQRNEALFAHATVEPASVALLFSRRSYLVEWCDFRQSNLSTDSMSGYYRMFWEANIPVDVLHEEHSDEKRMAGYRLIVLPQPCALSARARKALMSYVERGGAILSDPYFCPYDEHFHLDTQVPGGGFDRVFGAEEDDIFSAARQEMPVAFEGRDRVIAGSHFRETFRLTTGHPLGTYRQDGSAWLVENRFGQGRAWLSGLNLGATYAPRQTVADDFARRGESGGSVAAKEIVLSLAHRLGVRSRIVLNAPHIHGGLLLNAAGDDALILTNHRSERQCAQARLSGGYAAWRNLLGQERGDVARGALTLDFGPLETKVIRLQKETA